MNQGSMLSGGPKGRVPNIDESPTFKAYVESATAIVINSGAGTTGSVGDGESI